MKVLTLQIWIKNDLDLAEKVDTCYFTLDQEELALKKLLLWYKSKLFIYGDITTEPLHTITLDVCDKIDSTKVIVTLEKGEDEKYQSLIKKVYHSEDTFSKYMNFIKHIGKGIISDKERKSKSAEV